jgi:hypothetical protein
MVPASLQRRAPTTLPTPASGEGAGIRGGEPNLPNNDRPMRADPASRLAE